MILTYIYGTPQGFDFYEHEVAWEKYFQSFYVSSRKGKRLMVNRRTAGSTVYSFLCYGLTDKGRRPNAFFGFSVILGDNMYSPDLKELYDWFDYLFTKLVDRGVLFSRNDGGILQYKTSRFADVRDEMEWLKSNLPNIFTKTSSGISFRSYDGSYSSHNIGRVVCCNIDTPTSKIVETLKKSHWIAVSPLFAPEEELEEISFSDLEDKRDKYTQSLLSLAVNLSPRHLSDLMDVAKECDAVIKTLRKHVNAAKDAVEEKNCVEIGEKYRQLHSDVSTLIAKIRHQEQLPPERSEDYGGIVPGTSDGESPLIQESYAGKDVQLDDGGSPLQRWFGLTSPGLLAAIVVGTVLGIIGVFFSVKSCNSSVNDDGQNLAEETNVSEEVFDYTKFYSMLNSEDYSGAVDYVKSLNDTTFISEIKKFIDSRLKQIQTQTQPSETANELQKFIVMYESVLKELGYDVGALRKLAEQFRLPEDHASTNTNEPQQPLQDAKEPVTLTVTNTDNQGNTLSTDKSVATSKEYEFQAETFVTITPSRPAKLTVDYPKLNRLKNGGIRIELIKDKPVTTVKTGDITITIKVKANNVFKKVK